jgi:hypothetical protein
MPIGSVSSPVVVKGPSSLGADTPVVAPKTAEAPATIESVIKSWSTAWKQALRPRSAETDKALAEEAKETIAGIQDIVKKDQGQVYRAQHAKALYATTAATFKVSDNLPPELARGPFKPGSELRAIVRLSNVSGHVSSDDEPDLRGIGIRLTDDVTGKGGGHVQDFLMNTSVEFMAKDAKDTLAGARAREKGAKGLPGLIADMGLFDAIALIRKTKSVKSKDVSLAAHSFWTRTPFQLGEHAVKYRLVPVDANTNKALTGDGFDELKDDLQARLQKGPVKYLLQVQGFKDEKSTPMEDARVAWNDSPFITVGELTLPKIDSSNPEKGQRAVRDEVDKLAFSPFNTWTPDDMTPLGEINSIRKAAYDASAEGRGVVKGTGARCPFGFG